MGDVLYPSQVLPGCPSPPGGVRNPSPEDAADRVTDTGDAHHSRGGGSANFSDLLKHGGLLRDQRDVGGGVQRQQRS
jgi:hypothetical protein